MGAVGRILSAPRGGEGRAAEPLRDPSALAPPTHSTVPQRATWRRRPAARSRPRPPPRRGSVWPRAESNTVRPCAPRLRARCRATSCPVNGGPPSGQGGHPAHDLGFHDGAERRGDENGAPAPGRAPPPPPQRTSVRASLSCILPALSPCPHPRPSVRPGSTPRPVFRALEAVPNSASPRRRRGSSLCPCRATHSRPRAERLPSARAAAAPCPGLHAKKKAKK